MKTYSIYFYLLSILLLVALSVFSQESVNYNSSLYTAGQFFVNNTLESASFAPGAPGSSSWDFTTFPETKIDTFFSVEYSSTIPDIGSCAETPNYIVYYFTETDTSEAEGWAFYEVDSLYLKSLGLYGDMTVSGSYYSLTAFNSSYTPTYNFPVNYPDSWAEISHGEGEIEAFGLTIDYEYEDTIYHRVDGWGNITLPCGTFPALRVKRFHFRHTHSSHFAFGFDKTTRQYSYTWITTDLGIPVTFSGPIDSTGGIPDSNFTTGKLVIQIQNSALRIEECKMPSREAIKAYPNPFNSEITIENPNNLDLDIYDIHGTHIANLGKSNSWEPSENQCSGIFFIKSSTPGYHFTRRIIYLK